MIKIPKKYTWQKSQTSSGYYKKNPKKNGYVFINFNKTKNGTYNIEKRVGLHTPLYKKRIIGKAKTKAVALKKAKTYMAKN